MDVWAAYERNADTGPHESINHYEEEDDAYYGSGELPKAGDAGVVLRRLEERRGGGHVGTGKISGAL